MEKLNNLHDQIIQKVNPYGITYNTKTCSRTIRKWFAKELGVKRLDFYMHPEWFVEVCKRIYSKQNYNFDKTLDSYKSLNEPVIFTCPIHGDVEILAEDLYDGYGCPYCSNNIGILNNLKEFKDNQGKYPEGLENINDYISITEEQKEFLYKNYVFNGYLRASHFERLREKYPDLYESLFTGKNDYNRKIVAINIINLLNLPIEEDPKCLICGKPAKWNDTYKCWFPTDCSECGRKLSMQGLNDHLSSLGVVNSSQLGKTQRTKNNILYKELRERLAPEFTIITPVEKFNGLSHKDKNGVIHWEHYLVKCNTCGTIFEAFLGKRGFRGDIIEKPACPTCVPRCKGYSLLEKEVVDYVKSIYKGNVIENTRSLLGNREEIDIYIPDKHLAIEFDGLLWHGEANLYKEVGTNKDPTYHVNKTNICMNKGIDLLHIFEDEWNDSYKQEIIKSIISHKLGSKIKIKNYEIKEISQEDANNFFDLTNLYGSLEDPICNKTLMFKDKIIACFSYNKESFRFSQALDCEVESAFEILLKEVNLSSFTFKVDRRFFSGNSFVKVGCSLKTLTGPFTFWTNGNFRCEEKLNENFWRIWDCGSFIFEI